jgi:carboxylesterase
MHSGQRGDRSVAKGERMGRPGSRDAALRDPFSFEGGSTGIVLVHSFTGTPSDVRLIGEYLHARGLGVRGPLLPGHGTTLEDLNQRSWREWVACAERALDELLAACDRVFIGGLSLGALVSAYVAVHRPEVRGAVLYSPPTWPANRLIYLSGLGKHFVSTIPKTHARDLVDPQARARQWHYRRWPVSAAHQLLLLTLRVRRLLPRLTCPLLVFYTTRDTSNRPYSAPRTFRRAGARDKKLVRLDRSGHALTVDAEWRRVAEQTAAFLAQYAE